MKTIHIDLSNKNVLPVVYAKQGDVGRKFAVVFTEAGTPYNIPNDAHLSVWYDGDSGDGNYTHIGEDSAFLIDGNTVEVEMITQMLSVPGRGNMCIVLANGEGEQIGSWNITYVCEERPGFDSEGAKSYFNAFSEVIEAAAKFTVDKTLSKSGSPADAAVTGSRIEAERKLRESEIAVERARINELVAMRTDDGSIQVDLSADAISGYIKTNGFHAYASFTVKNVTLGSAEAWISDYFIPKELCPFTKNGPTYTEWFHAIGKDEIFIEVIQDSQTGMIKLRIYNESEETITGNLYIYGEYALAEPYCNELADIRIGFNGKTYPTAGEAVRGQIQQVIAAQPSAIECTASGTVVSVADASDAPLRGLTLYGKTTQNGTPTPDAPVALESAGDSGKVEIRLLGNLLNVDAMCNDNLVKNADGSYTMTKTGTNSADRFSAWFSTSLPAGSYVIKASLVDTNAVGEGYLLLNVKYADGSYTSFRVLQEKWSGRSMTFQKAVTGLRLFIYPAEEVGTYCTFRDLQLDAGNSAAPHFPYIEPQTLSVNTPNGLPGVPCSSGGNYTDENGQAWICDEIDLERGVYVQNVTKVVFDSKSPSITIDPMTQTPSTNVRFNLTNRDITVMQQSANEKQAIMSNYAPAAVRQNTSGVWMKTSDGHFTGRLSVDSSIVSTVEGLRELLAVTPIEFIVPLAEPVETPIPESELAAHRALHTNKPHTVVLNDAGAGMAVSYVADTKTYIDNKIYEVAAAIVSNA